jgi:hypothetical protein
MCTFRYIPKFRRKIHGLLHPYLWRNILPLSSGYRCIFRSKDLRFLTVNLCGEETTWSSSTKICVPQKGRATVFMCFLSCSDWGITRCGSCNFGHSSVLMMAEVCLSETLVSTCKSAGRYKPEDQRRHLYGFENLKFHIT